MTFPNDIHRHPKITRLSLAARWAFVEMNGEARLADNDGLFSVEDALYLWPQEILDELCSSHPTRPLVVFDADAKTYLIRDYAEHQQTRAEREALSEKRARAGRASGKARASVEQVLSKSEQTRTEKEIEKEITSSNELVVAAKRGTRLPADWMPSRDLIAWATTQRHDLNVPQQVDAFRDYWTAQPGQKGVKLDWDATWRNWIRNARQGSRSQQVTPAQRMAQTLALASSLPELEEIA